MRKMYEKINLYIYIVIPFFMCFIYYFLLKYQIFNLQTVKNYTERKFDFILSLLGTLLTIYGFMMVLPENKFRLLLRKYKQEEIINKTIFIGIIACLAFVLMYLFGFENFYNDLLFIIASTETLISTHKIYNILKYIGK